jgi:fumarate reductase flavoprotein subunit
MTEDHSASVDVLVIGAGGCGLTAALAAHDAGSEVAILEKARVLGGNTALSSGSIPAAPTQLQSSAGVEDSAAIFAGDLRAASGHHDADALIDVLAETSGALIDFLVEKGVTLDLITAYKHVGHTTHRLHAPPSRRGSSLLEDLAIAVRKRDIPLALGHPATGLVSDDGRVVGARAGDDTIAADAIVLACNGFGAASELLAEHCPSAAEATYAGSPDSTGDAIVWGRDVGAATGNMAAYQGHAALSVKTGALMTWTLIERGGFIVDRNGRRFGDETLGYSGFADLELGATGPFHLIYDVSIRDGVAAGQPQFAEACAFGAAVTEADVHALARRIGLPEDMLAATLAETQASALGDRADLFGRADWGSGPLGDPLCATQIEPALFHTQGGLKIDTSARVLDMADRPIPGLFAGGGAAMGISGRAGGGGYMSGNGLLSALGLGLIAGRSAANERRPTEQRH